MRAKRQVRAPPVAGVHLSLPKHNSAEEIQVLPKSENELNGLLIDADQTLPSPMFLTGSQFPGIHPPAALQPNGAGHDANAGKGFYHLNNTNLFILVDGISMFVDGRATYRGAQDAEFLAEIRRKRAENNGDSVETIDSPAHVFHDPSYCDTDTVRNVIQHVERIVNGPTDVAGSSAGSGHDSRSASPTAPFPRHSTFFPTPTSATPPTCADPSASSRASSPPPPLVGTNAVAGCSSCANSTAPTSPAGSPHSPEEELPAAYVQLFSNARPFPEGYKPVFRRQYARKRDRPVVPRPAPVKHHALSTKKPERHRGLQSKAAHAHTLSSSADFSRVMSPTSSTSKRTKQLTAKDVGRSSRSLELEKLEFVRFVDSGSQGDVYVVADEERKHYALKVVDMSAIHESAQSDERQGRKRGFVQELSMIKEQALCRPQYLMGMFNAVLCMNGTKVCLLLELMSFGVDKLQSMVSRLPAQRLSEITTAVMGAKLNRGEAVKKISETLTKQFSTAKQCQRIFGRDALNTPVKWEKGPRPPPFPLFLLSFLASDVLHGLKELHTQFKKAHCDLKPANVLLDCDRQRFKISDFGCGCALGTVPGDQGTYIYKAPERLEPILSDDAMTSTPARTEPLPGSLAASRRLMSRSSLFDSDTDGGQRSPQPPPAPVTRRPITEKADVWSLGIMLLELANGGVHPCERFKSDFWRYRAQLNLRQMTKPLNWSAVFADFIFHTVCVDEAERWSVDQLLLHPLVTMYSSVPRTRLRKFIDRLEEESASYHMQKRREEMKRIIESGMNRARGGNDAAHSKALWESFTGNYTSADTRRKPETFPQLK